MCILNYFVRLTCILLRPIRHLLCHAFITSHKSGIGFCCDIRAGSDALFLCGFMFYFEVAYRIQNLVFQGVRIKKKPHAATLVTAQGLREFLCFVCLSGSALDVQTDCHFQDQQRC